MTIVSSHWMNKKFHGHPVVQVVVSCFDNSKREEPHQQDTVAAFNSASMTSLKTDPDLMARRKSYKFLVKHIDR